MVEVSFFGQVPTLRMIVGGMQCTSKSYSLPRTCSILAGVCSAMMSLATCSMSASQSGGGIIVFSDTFSLFECQCCYNLAILVDILLRMYCFVHQ